MQTPIERYWARRAATLLRCGLRHHEEWPLFGVVKHISKARQVWVILQSLPPLDKHPDGLRHLLAELRRLEHRLESEGIVGWMMAIRKDNWKMRHCVELIGATWYSDSSEHWHFKRLADPQTLPKSVKDAVKGGLHHGTA